MPYNDNTEFPRGLVANGNINGNLVIQASGPIRLSYAILARIPGTDDTYTFKSGDGATTYFEVCVGGTSTKVVNGRYFPDGLRVDAGLLSAGAFFFFDL